MEKRPSQTPIPRPSTVPPINPNHSADKPSYTSSPSRPVTPKK